MSDEKEGWAPARILKESGDSASVQLQHGAKRTVKRSAKEPLWPLNHSSLARIEDDLVMVDAINQVRPPMWHTRNDVAQVYRGVPCLCPGCLSDVPHLWKWLRGSDVYARERWVSVGLSDEQKQRCCVRKMIVEGGREH